MWYRLVAIGYQIRIGFIARDYELRPSQDSNYCHRCAVCPGRLQPIELCHSEHTFEAALLIQQDDCSQHSEDAPISAANSDPMVPEMLPGISCRPLEN
jgi:hypothetical protein